MRAPPTSPQRIVLYSPLQVDPASGVSYSKDITPLALLTIAGGPVRDGYEVVLVDGALYSQEEAHRRVLEACDGALLYATTREFLNRFGLNTPKDLPASLDL